MVDESLSTASSLGKAAFREKVDYMKAWKPSSAPSNRDRLELYALHKQSISGDAPAATNAQTAAERAKYQAWRAKSGLSPSEAMRLYITESERQVRVYGQQAIPALPSTAEAANGTTPQQQTPQNTPHHTLATSQQQQQNHSVHQQPRGLAAIPLLCAAASESRMAYIRRMGNTAVDHGWWSRQEPLCGTPGTLWAMPEHVLLWTAALQERIALTTKVATVDEEDTPTNTTGCYFPFVPISVLQSFLWPFHNCLLAAWMGMVLTLTVWTACAEIAQTVLWGSRRTGLSLGSIWKDEVIWSSQMATQLTESHQAIAARLIGLFTSPLQMIVLLCDGWVPGGILWTTLAYAVFLLATWWYWLVVVPWMGLCMLGISLVTVGPCFALIEIASV